MRKVVIALILLAIMAPAINARRPKDKAGLFKDNVYRDKKYDFELTVPDGWKCKVMKNDDSFRFTLIQNSFEIPSYYIDAPDYTQIPRTVVFVDTTSMSARVFLDSLVAEDYRSDQKKEILKEFDILNRQSAGSGMTREDVVSRKKKRLNVGDLKGMYWTGQVNYRNEVAESSSSVNAAKRVHGALGGLIVTIKKENTIMVFHTICEWTYFEGIRGQMLDMVNTLKWGE